VTSRERVHAALRREPVDRVPIFMWYHPGTVQRLAEALELPSAQLSEALGDDIRQSWVGNNSAMEGTRLAKDGNRFTDPWGIEWVKAGPFNEIARPPLCGATSAEIEAYAYPTDQIETLVMRMEEVVASGNEWFLGCDVSPCVFEMVNRVRGMEDAIMDLAAEPEQAALMLGRAAEFSVRLAEVALSRYAVDWLWTGDDVGGQDSMIMSPACWRELIGPQLQRVVDVGRTHGVWVAYHSCGSIRPIIPDLIEMGVDVLNPIQCNCPGMDPLELKREFGADLAFMGGVDTQEILPRGSADDVYRATRRLVDGMTTGGGGYILAASHTVPPETPLANIFAMYDAAGLSRQAIMDAAAMVRARPLA